jgi:hypothetical protein
MLTCTYNKPCTERYSSFLFPTQHPPSATSAIDPHTCRTRSCKQACMPAHSFQGRTVTQRYPHTLGSRSHTLSVPWGSRTTSLCLLQGATLQLMDRACIYKVISSQRAVQVRPPSLEKVRGDDPARAVLAQSSAGQRSEQRLVCRDGRPLSSSNIRFSLHAVCYLEPLSCRPYHIGSVNIQFTHDACAHVCAHACVQASMPRGMLLQAPTHHETCTCGDSDSVNAVCKTLRSALCGCQPRT